MAANLAAGDDQGEETGLSAPDWPKAGGWLGWTAAVGAELPPPLEAPLRLVVADGLLGALGTAGTLAGGLLAPVPTAGLVYEKLRTV